MIICVLFYRLGFCIVTSSKDRGSSSEVVLKFLQNLWKNTCGGLSFFTKLQPGDLQPY